MPFSVVWCLLINRIGRLVGRGYLHYLCPLTSQYYKRRQFKNISSGAAGKARSVFDTRDPRSHLPFAEIILLIALQLIKAIYPQSRRGARSNAMIFDKRQQKSSECH